MKKRLFTLALIITLVFSSTFVYAADTSGLLKGVLEINKDVIYEGEPFELSVEVSNRKANSYINAISVTNVLPDGVEIISVTSNNGTAAVHGQSVSVNGVDITSDNILLTMNLKAKPGNYVSKATITSETMDLDLELDFTVLKKGEEPKPVDPKPIDPTFSWWNHEEELLNKDDHYAYLVGYPDGRVKPEANITRGEVSTIFFRMMTDSARNKYLSSNNSFTDVKAGDWYNNAISTLSNAGAIKGYPEGHFNPEGNITRGEFATMTSYFLKSSNNITNNKLNDISGNWAEAEIKKLMSNGLISGYPDGSFKPEQEITRAEVTVLINGLLERTPSKDKLLSNMKVWPDNANQNTWYYAQIQEATNSHTYERKNNSSLEQWLKIISSRDWTLLEK